MATATLSPQPVPDAAATMYVPHRSALTVLEEVEASQQLLRERLAGALTTPPPGVSEESLPSVPLVDIGPSFSPDPAARRQVAAQIRAACVTSGFFQICNHGVPRAAADGVLAQAARFFHELTPAQKDALHIRHSPLFRGYEPADASLVNPDDAAASSETKEAFNWGYEAGLDPTGGDGAYVELDGRATSHANVWPDPTALPGFYDGVRDYYGAVLALARHLFRLFALSLELDETYFDALTTHPGGVARMLYYAGQPEGNTASTDDTAAAVGSPVDTAASDADADKQNKLGLGAHTDYECFTLLLSSASPGLEILFPPTPATHNRPLWRACPVRPDTLTVNVADFLQRWTNGLYKSTIHRVVSKPGTPARYSVPFFFSVNYDADVEALPEWAVGRSAVRPLRAGEYVLERLRATAVLEARAEGTEGS